MYGKGDLVRLVVRFWLSFCAILQDCQIHLLKLEILGPVIQLVFPFDLLILEAHLDQSAGDPTRAGALGRDLL